MIIEKVDLWIFSKTFQIHIFGLIKSHKKLRIIKKCQASLSDVKLKLLRLSREKDVSYI